MNYNDLAKTIYEQNKAVGWWDDPDRCVYQTLQLVNTEIAEATEAERKDLMDDHLPHRKGGEVELADAMIRLLDMAGAYGWGYDQESGESNLKDWMAGVNTIAGKHFVITGVVCALGACIYDDDGENCINDFYSTAMKAIELASKSQGYDLEGALHEKLAYNAKRADHKRENRAKENGKKF